MVNSAWYFLIGFVFGILFVKRNELVSSWKTARAFAEAVMGVKKSREDTASGSKVVVAEVVKESKNDEEKNQRDLGGGV